MKTLKDVIASFEIETYSCPTHQFTEYTLRTKCDPRILVQLLAFNGLAWKNDGEHLHVTDWETLPKDVLDDIRQIAHTSFNGVLSGRNKRETDGSYILKSVSCAVTVTDGQISIPNNKVVKARATDLKRRTVLSSDPATN